MWCDGIFAGVARVQKKLLPLDGAKIMNDLILVIWVVIIRSSNADMRKPRLASLPRSVVWRN